MNPAFVPWATSAAFAAIIFALAALIPAAPPAPGRADVEAVEALLGAHGIDVAGFADRRPLDFEAIDTMAPPECVTVLRRAYAARVAIVTAYPEHVTDAAGLARAVAAITARETGQEGCVP